MQYVKIGYREYIFSGTWGDSDMTGWILETPSYSIYPPYFQRIKKSTHCEGMYEQYVKWVEYRKKSDQTEQYFTTYPTDVQTMIHHYREGYFNPNSKPVDKVKLIVCQATTPAVIKHHKTTLTLRTVSFNIRTVPDWARSDCFASDTIVEEKQEDGSWKKINRFFDYSARNANYPVSQPIHTFLTDGKLNDQGTYYFTHYILDTLNKKHKHHQWSEEAVRETLTLI